MVGVHARQIANRVANIKLNHTNNAFARLLAPVVQSDRQMLYQADPLGYFHLLLLGQVAHRAADRRRRIEDWLQNFLRTEMAIQLAREIRGPIASIILTEYIGGGPSCSFDSLPVSLPLRKSDTSSVVERFKQLPMLIVRVFCSCLYRNGSAKALVTIDYRTISMTVRLNGTICVSSLSLNELHFDSRMKKRWIELA